jgi:hypothetical protein
MPSTNPLRLDMTELRIDIAQDINRHHDLASLRATEAVNHAVEAGKLLMEVKGAMPHGKWLPWLDQNVRVTPRQAQRYMQVAQGRPLPIRAIPPKATSVSHLEVDAPRLLPGDPPAASFIPEEGWCYAAAMPDESVYAVEPSRKHPGFFFVSKLGVTDEVSATRRPVGAAWVETTLQFFGLDDPSAAPWRQKPSEGVLEAMETLLGSVA